MKDRSWRAAPTTERGVLLGLCIMVGLAAACDTNSPTYVEGNAPLEVGGTAADGTANPSSMTDTTELAFRAPTDAEQGALDALHDQLGFEVPWLQRKDLAIEVLYTIENLDDTQGTAQVLVNGADEFTNYDVAKIEAFLEANIARQEDRPVVLSLVQGIPVILGPHQTYDGVAREDDFAEAELDLDAIGRFMAPPAAVLINRSEVNPIGLEHVPAGEIVPAMYRLEVTLTASTHMRCTYVVRVRDGKGRLWNGSDPRFQPQPMDFTPPIAGM
jgi:hypothetical protein